MPPLHSVRLGMYWELVDNQDKPTFSAWVVITRGQSHNLKLSPFQSRDKLQLDSGSLSLILCWETEESS